MSLNPRVCKKSYKVHIPMMGEACEFWLITVTDEQSITNPDKDHAYLTDDGKLFVFNGDSLVRVNCDICFTQEEREKLEGIEENANNYTLPEADSNKLGGVVLGYTQNGKNYPVVKDSDGRIYVQVPWEEYQLPKATDNALGGIKTGYKQNGKFYPIKTDTDGNAYVQVPWEDTNTVYEVVSKTSNGLMPMLPSDENASKRFLNGDGEWVVGTDNSINGVTQTGSTFSGETSDCGVQILEVQGKTEQGTTNGYQLFDSSKLATTSKGGATVTNNNDGSLTISGSGNLTENFSLNYYYSKEDTLSLLKAGTLKANGLGNASPNVLFGLRNKNTGSYITGKSVSKTVNSCQIEQSDLDSLGDDIVLSISMYTAQGTQITGGTIKPMLYQDGDGTWEPYTGGKPAPNADYPMEIKNVEIKNIVSITDNMFDIDRNITSPSCKITKLGDNEIKIEVISESTYQAGVYTFNDDELNLVKGKKVTLYKEIVDESDCYPIFQLIVFSPTGEQFISSSGTIKNDATSIRVCLYVNNSPNTIPIGSFVVFKNVKIIIGDTENTDWTPYRFNKTQTSLTLAEGDVYENGVATKARGHATFDGSDDEGWSMNETGISGVYRFSIKVPDSDIGLWANKKRQICNRFSVGDTWDKFKGDCFSIDGNKYLTVYIDSLKNSSLDEFIKWLKAHPIEIEYELATPTTEEFKVPTIPSYEPYTEISTNSVVDPTITFRPLPFTTCLVGEATEEESGYMPPLSGNSNEFLNGSGEWSVPSGYTLPTASSTVLGGVKIGENITISSGTISIDKEDVTGALGYTPPTTNTTYSVATTSKDGLMSSTDKTKLTNLRRIWKGTSSSPPSRWVDGDIYVQYEE